MISVLLLSCSFLALSAQAPGDSDKPEPQAAAIVAAIEKVIADAIASAEPSVVAIHRSKNENGPETLAIRGRKRARNVPMFLTRRASPIPDLSNMLSFDYGSGVVIGDQGEILTLYHVVRGASELYVRAAGRQLFEAEVIAADPRSDLAVIVPAMSEGAEFPRLKPIAIGDSGRLRKGAFLIALGNSFNAARRMGVPRRAGASFPMCRAVSSSTSTSHPDLARRWAWVWCTTRLSCSWTRSSIWG